ncbi:unnamed protein product [Didymodactylos carnosus]|uniref:PROP1-like PPR domain-containing protein n=1 Tax=Didymodactylos carnosus TaxID=1234261 RepID=A0A814GWJ8_9BILA|nr:unnamed protein product [Didymodactylos carnosus]CAF1002378.1 unnamed protein product [Didymodactylos carnosus]CAF3749753.1 unnamed protein product [Didymodactylos carnosus]CAF3773796.1 unnamed protein product [Didymodactylos carnosus]
MFLRYLNSYTIRSSITHLSLLTRRTQLCSNCTQKFMINSLLVKTSLPLSQHHFIRQQATTTTTTQPSQFDYSSNNDNKNVFHRIHSSKLDLDSLLERLDGEAHRRGRLTPGLVNEAIRKATIELEYINPTQALLLIRCSGSLLLGELPIQRQQVLEQMMNVFKTKNVQFDITHYNSYMRVCLQNSHYFDPDKILNDIKIYGAKSNIQPNLTTYKLFMECYAKQGRSNDAQKVLELMKQSNFNIESHTLTCLIESYAQQGNYDKVQQLFQLFDELTLKPISQTYEQFVIVYFKQGQFLDAKKYFILNSSKMDNDTFYRLLILSATYNQHDMFQLILDTIDKNVLADTCIQYILYTAELLSKNLDDYAFMLIKTFPERDETLRFDVLNYTFLNLLKIRLPIHHFKPFSSINIEQRTKGIYYFFRIIRLPPSTRG